MIFHPRRQSKLLMEQTLGGSLVVIGPGAKPLVDLNKPAA
jgi:hypothetical protein